MATPLAIIKKTIYKEFYYFECACGEPTYIATMKARHIRKRDKVFCSECGTMHRPRFDERHDCDKD